MFSHLLALHPTHQAILKVRISDGSAFPIVTGLTGFPDGIVVDHERRRIYWTNMGVPGLPGDRPPRGENDLDFYQPNGSIESAGLDGALRSRVLPEGSFVTGKQLVGAWSRRRLYWSDREGAAVRSVALDGSDLRDEVLVASTDSERHLVRNQCVGVAIDEEKGYLYWTQKGPSDGDEGRIFRAPLDIPSGQTAAERDIEVLWAGLPEPIDLELDRSAGVLYWTDRGNPPGGNTLNRAAVPAPGRRGGPVDILAAGFHEAIGLALDFEAAVAYVSDLSGEIRAVGLDGAPDRVVAKVDGGLTGIAGIHE